VSAQEIFERESHLFATKDLSSSLDNLPSLKIIIKSAASLSGKLDIKVANQTGVKLSYSKQAKTTSRTKAIDHIDLISVSLEQVGGAGRLEFRAPNPSPWDMKTESGIIEAVLTLPENCAVEIEATYFDISAVGPISSLLIPASLGRLQIAGVTRLLDVTTNNRRIELHDISGEISVATTNSSIEATKIRSSGTQANFRNEGGDIKLIDFEGAINARNNFGKIELIDFKPSGESNFIRGASGPIIIEITRMSEGQLVVDNKQEDIDITLPDTISSFVSLSVDEEGLIEVGKFPFRTDLVQRNRLNLYTGKGTVDINCSIKGKGNIYLRKDGNEDISVQ